MQFIINFTVPIINTTSTNFSVSTTLQSTITKFLITDTLTTATVPMTTEALKSTGENN